MTGYYHKYKRYYRNQQTAAVLERLEALLASWNSLRRNDQVHQCIGSFISRQFLLFINSTNKIGDEIFSVQNNIFYSI